MPANQMVSTYGSKAKSPRTFRVRRTQTAFTGNKRAARTCLLPEHRDLLLQHIKKDDTLVRLMKDNPGGIFISGGFPVCSLIDSPISDIDIFGRDRVSLFEAARVYGLYSPRHLMEPTKYTVSVNGKIGRVQFVVKEIYQSAQACIDSFDFSVCQAAIWFENGEWQTTCSPHFYHDIKARRLRFVNQERVNESPGASLWRAAKYAERGFKLSRNDKLALLERFFQNCHRKHEEQSGKGPCDKEKARMMVIS